jgi:hypothetical protein
MTTERFRPLLIGDVHVADRPPSIRVEGYKDQILAKVRAAGEIALEQGCTHIVQLGDLFHLKTPSRNSHGLVQETHEALTTSGLPVIIVSGNHDMSHDRIESLTSQPLGTLGRMPGIELLAGAHSSLPLFSVPYLSDFGAQLPEWLWKYREFAAPLIAAGQTPLVISHAPVFPTGQEPPYGYILDSDWADLQGVGDLAYGHIHDPFGEWVVGGVHFGNFGAISRGSLHEKTLARVPKVSVWDPDNEFHFTPFELPHLPVRDVFRLAEHEEVQERQEQVSAFLGSVQDSVIVQMGVSEVMEHVRSLGLPVEVEAICVSVLEGVDG